MAHCEGAASPRRERPELAEILRQYGGERTGEAGRVVRALIACRTAALGGHLQRCDLCGEERPVYNSCRNRHCPKCQSLDQARWVEGQAMDLLPIPYFHVVFTIPDRLNRLFLESPKVAHPILFEAASRTVLEVSRRRLWATPGVIAVLHTWTQTLLYHPHVHMIVTGGGLSLDGAAWINSPPRFFLPVRVLSAVFRGKLLDGLDQGLERKHLGTPPHIARPLLGEAAKKAFVVYAKAPLAGPEQVLRYLGRYTHRIAIGNERLVAYRDGDVTFSYRDRRHGGRRRCMTIKGAEFTRRFLLHVLPRRLVRIRHYGFLANRIKARSLTRARELLNAPPPPTTARPREAWNELYRRLVGDDPTRCPRCGEGHFVVVSTLPPQPSVTRQLAASGRSP